MQKSTGKFTYVAAQDTCCLSGAVRHKQGRRSV